MNLSELWTGGKWNKERATPSELPAAGISHCNIPPICNIFSFLGYFYTLCNPFSVYDHGNFKMIEQDGMQENFIPFMASYIPFHKLVLEHVPGLV